MKILCPLPSIDFDPTEVSVPWQALTHAGHNVIFATPDAASAVADFRMVTGIGLGLFKSILMADQHSLAIYDGCIKSREFLNPISYQQIVPNDYDALLLPGGHAKGMRPYLDSKLLQANIVSFFQHKKPVAAICHGTLCAARCVDKATSKSVLYGLKTTGLTFKQELSAWLLTCLWLGDYYRTYPQFMQQELQSYLQENDDFKSGPMPLLRDTATNFKAGFTVRDGNYLSARWPGDVHLFASEFLKML